MFFFFFKQKTAYEMRISDWSSDVCSSDLPTLARTEKVLAVLAQQIDGVRKSPAMTLTPDNMGSRLNASVMETVNTLRAQAQASKTALDGTVGELRGLVLSAHTDREQNRDRQSVGAGKRGADRVDHG